MKAVRGNQGFTLIEVMIVVAIVTILAAVSYPSYREYLRRGALIEAGEMLTQAKIAMDQYYQSYRAFPASGQANTPCAARAGKSFDQECDVKGLTYSIWVSGRANTLAAGFVYVIDQNGTKMMKVDGVDGWPASASCWLFKRGGSC